jgi:hypothetical protein
MKALIPAATTKVTVVLKEVKISAANNPCMAETGTIF